MTLPAMLPRATNMSEHKEFVCEFHNGEMDWVDPVIEVTEGDHVIEINNGAHSYKYNKADIKKWCIRPYSECTTHNKII